MTAIFISHRSSDEAETRALRDWLSAQGHEQLFLDFDPEDGIPAGVDWEQRLYRELRRCQALLVVLTPAWLSSMWCRSELAIAREKGKAIFVVRVEHCPDGPLIPAIQEVDLTVDREASLAKLARGLKEHGLDPASAFDFKPDRPIYPGLAAFDVEDAAIFFGRSEESSGVVELLRHMRLQATGAPKLLLITGASGSGKSSLMRAGVLARLRKESASWIVARPFRRGADAVGALAEALAFAFPPDRRSADLEMIAGRLAGAGGADELLALARELRLTLDRPEATLVLALDQAEELLEAERPDDSVRFVDLVRTALARVGSELLLLATIRSDRLGGFQQHPSIKATAGHGEFPFEMLPLGPMPMTRVGEIVRGPATYEGLRIDDELVDAIRADTATPDALPLLAYTLQYLHSRFAADGRLTLVQYRSFNGLEGSIRSQADAAIPIEKLSADDRSALKEAFVPGLVRATPEGGFSRGRAPLATLPPRAEPYLRRLIDEARLLRTDIGPDGRIMVEVAHEALLRVWPTLERWISEDALSLRRMEALQRAAADWIQNSRGDDFLIHQDHRLADAEALAAVPRFAARLEPADRDYLVACRFRQNERERKDKEARERELRSAQELASRRRIQVRGAIAAAMILLVFAGAALWQWREAIVARNTAEEAAQEAHNQLIRANAALATGLWNDLDFADPDSLAPAELKGIWTLTTDQGEIRDAFVAQLLPEPGQMERFTRRGEVIGRALGLGWPSLQQAVELVSPVLDILKQTTEEQTEALGATLQMAVRRLSPEQASNALGRVINAGRDLRGRSQFQVLTQAAATLAGKLTAAQAQAVLAQVVDTVKGADKREIRMLAHIARSLRPQLTRDQAQAALGPVLAPLAPDVLYLQLQALAAMPALPLSLTSEETKAALAKLLDEMQVAPTRHVSPAEKAQSLENLAGATQALAPQLTAESAQGAFGSVVQSLKAAEDPGAVQALALAAQALAERLTPEQALAELESIRDAVGKESDSVWSAAPEPVFRTLAAKLTPDQARAVFNPMVQAVEEATELSQIEVVAPLLETLVRQVTAQQARAALGRMLASMKGTQVSGLPDALVPALKELAGRLSSDEVRDALIPVLTALAAEGEFNTVALLLKVSVKPLQGDQGQAVLAALLEPSAGTTMSQPQAEALKVLGVPLTAPQEQAALEPLLADFRRQTNPVRLGELARTIRTAGLRLTAKQEETLRNHVLAATARHGKGPALLRYLDVLQELQVPLTSAQRNDISGWIMAALPGVKDARRFEGLTRAAQSLAGELTVDQTRPSVATLRTVLAWTPTAKDAAAWAAAFAALLPKDGQCTIAEIVEVLKYPSVAGPATGVLLEAMRSVDSRAPGGDAGLPASLAWLRGSYPSIDLNALPTCPPPPPEMQDLACPAIQN